MAKKQLSIFIPFYNEEKNLEKTIEIAHGVAKKCVQEFEIILVNDGSDDSSIEISKKMAEKFLEISIIDLKINTGFGNAYLTGFKKSQYSFAMYLCADGDVTKNELENLLTFWNGEDPLIQYCINGKNRKIFRLILSSLYTIIISVLVCKKLPYFNGFNILPTNQNAEIENKDFGFSEQAYLIINAIDEKSKVQIFGMNCRFNDENSKAITIKNLTSTLRFIIYLIKRRWNGLVNSNSFS